jgi:hypothetical protein
MHNTPDLFQNRFTSPTPPKTGGEFISILFRF